MKFLEAKNQLDKVIKKSKIHFYRPIQVAEVLYHARIGSPGLDVKKLETYRTISRRWRDEQSIHIVGRVSTSSSRYQDDIWNKNAIPPEVLVSLSEENIKNNGIVEVYIYEKIIEKHMKIKKIFKHLKSVSNNGRFDLSEIIQMFSKDSGLKRSMDKIFEIAVYALFLSLTRELNIKIDIKIGINDLDLIKKFEDFTEKTFGLNSNELDKTLPAFIYRVGRTNAADRGLDMWSSFGTAIQVKYLSLTKDLADNISLDMSANRIIIVCKKAERRVINQIFSKSGSHSKILAIVTQKDLEKWYHKCLYKEDTKTLGKSLLKTFSQEFEYEFPFVGNYLDELFRKRGYTKVKSKNVV